MKISSINVNCRPTRLHFSTQKTNQNVTSTNMNNVQSNPLSLLSFTNGAYPIEKTQINQSLAKHSQDFHGLVLLQQDNVIDRNAKKYASAIDSIRKMGEKKLTSTEPLTPITRQHPHPSVWSVTSEFAPIKEGGLGSVPPEVRNNTVPLGVEMPTFVPMYLYPGKATLVKQGDNYKYIYKEKEMPLEKIATIKMDVYKDGKPSTIPVNYFLHTDKDENGNSRQLIFLHADNYFDGSIYEANVKTEEPEKFALMSKAVYEFAKLKMDGVKAVKEAEIASPTIMDSISAPDAMLLNDWQASPTAALLRYKAVMENAHNQLSDKTAKRMQEMNIVTIGHNVRYQGSTEKNDDIPKAAATSNILNTLFDKYAYDIVSNAQTNSSKIDPKDERAKMFENALVMELGQEKGTYTNFLNTGIVLSDYFCPVSENYAKELMQPDLTHLSKKLQWVITQKNKIGKLKGVINGNDFKNISLEANKSKIKELTGIDFKMYDKKTSIEEIMKNRADNKARLYQDFVLPFTQSSASSAEQIEKVKKITGKLEFVPGTRGTNLPSLNTEELKNTPIFMSGGRLAGQKGMDVMCDAIEILLNNWEKDFPGKNKPIFYIAGSDGEGGKQRKIIEEFKDEKLSKENSDRVLFAHGWAPMAAMMAGADFFLMSSKFEPCGLTQGESLALATPVIASAVGGLVDTINRDGKFNGVLTNKDETLTAQGFYEAIKEGLNIYFNEPEKYQNMVKDSISEDFSWAKENKEGPVYDYLELLGISK